MSREKILAEIAVADLTEAGVKPPKAPSQERKGVDKTKYCRFHKCHRNVTDDCIHLKDAVERTHPRRMAQAVRQEPRVGKKDQQGFWASDEVASDELQLLMTSPLQEHFVFRSTLFSGALLDFRRISLQTL
jgi:hypothetical protein